LMMDGWHDDVVDMLMGMLTMRIVRNSEVFELNVLIIFLHICYFSDLHALYYLMYVKM
jgi:hypothetical protein